MRTSGEEWEMTPQREGQDGFTLPPSSFGNQAPCAGAVVAVAGGVLSF